MMCGVFFRLFVACLLVQFVLTISENNQNENTSKTCRLITQLVDETVWNEYAGFYCYFYTNPARLLFRYPYSSLTDANNNKVPVSAYKNKTFTYNYHKEEDLELIRLSFKYEAAFNNYLSCCRDAEYCCKNVMNEENIQNGSTHCPVVWDAWSCFPRTAVNTVAKLPCSSQAYQQPDKVCTLESEKYCVFNSTSSQAEWIQKTNYAVCAMAPVFTKRYNFHVIILGICIGFCVPAICIFFMFEKLRRTIRVILHRNLLIAICVRNVFTILSKKLIILDQLKSDNESFHRMEHNGVGCRTLAFLETSSVNCIYACMFLDAFYLHKVIVRAFAKETKMVHIYIAMFGMTFLFSLSWAIAMASKGAENCWMVDVDNLQWIVDGFRISVLTINTVLLADIIRVMVLKLKHGSATKQTMAAFRATIFLIPLFGLHIIVTANEIVYDNSCTAEDVYNYARYTMEGLQGIVVSILFCYANSEVRNEIKNGYRKTCIFLNQKFGLNLGGDVLYDKRRATTATFVQDGYASARFHANAPME